MDCRPACDHPVGKTRYGIRIMSHKWDVPFCGGQSDWYADKTALDKYTIRLDFAEQSVTLPSSDNHFEKIPEIFGYSRKVQKLPPTFPVIAAELPCPYGIYFVDRFVFFGNIQQLVTALTDVNQLNIRL
jgi:hypothetical protein